MHGRNMYKLQENRLSDPRDEFCDEYKGEYGENEGHGENSWVARFRWPKRRGVLNPTQPRDKVSVPCASL
jgi:hypothetical protein